MIKRYTRIFRLSVISILVAGLVVFANLPAPSPTTADEGTRCKWDYVFTPGSGLPITDILRNSEINRLVAGPNSRLLAIVQRTTVPPLILYSSGSSGTSPGTSGTLGRAMITELGAQVNVWDAAVAPDDASFWAIVTSTAAFGPGDRPIEVWITPDAGTTWRITRLAGLLAAGETIRTIDVSPRCEGEHDIAVGTVTGAGAGRIWAIKSGGFSSWLAQAQPVVAGLGYDFFDLKFSPTYASDASLAAVFSDNVASTWYNIWLRDIARNTTVNWAFTTTPPGIEVRDPTAPAGASPNLLTLNRADLELPTDFSGQAASLRRAYISLDAWTGAPKVATDRDGIFRIDDTVVYILMDTSQNITKSIYSIAYFGTYASGKLLAGERMGFPCTATVPTWFTDSPTTCPVPCWYPALKPTTGAAGVACATTQTGSGGANVGWRADGVLAYVGTGSRPMGTGAGWFNPWLPPSVPIPNNDESAFAISRNNGETWNQLAIIDTTITRLVDVAPTPDCKTIYLASVNAGAICSGFDSVWRATINPEVDSPFRTTNPLGYYWERVLCHVTAPTCIGVQTDAALLRIVPYCADPTGQIVAWAVYDTASVYPNQGIAMWSPDYGDYWADIYPRNSVQDFCFESATVMYFLSPEGLVQKMPYNGTSWANTMDSVSALLPGMHTIAAYPEGKVLVGADATWSPLYAGSYSANFNTDTPSFATIALAGKTAAMGNVHVAFDTNFEDTNTIFIGDDDANAGAGLGGSVYRNSAAGAYRWADTNMMSALNGATGSLAPHEAGQYGIAIAFTGADGQCALYSAHNIDIVGGAVNSGVCRTLWPLNGMPKPGIIWDCLNAGLPAAGALNAGVVFTREPSSLKLCGCCTLDTDTTLYAIDNRAYTPATRIGMLWGFTDCLSKKGPALITEDKSLIGCDPVSGRAQEVNLCWEQLCIANAYDIEIAKLEDFSIRVVDWVVTGTVPPGIAPVGFTWPQLFLTPADVMTPCVYFPAGGATQLGSGNMSQIAVWGNLECGHTYYWRVQVRRCATTQIVRSPWSEIRSFTVKAGLPVTTPYYGPQLLAPNNGCLGCPVSPASFSWSPFKETTKYKFVLATDAAMTQIVKEAEVATTAFEYDGTLEYSTNYFWRIMAMEPAPSDWSATFSFQTGTPSTPSVSQVPSKAGFWGALAVPAKAISAWAASLNIQPISPMRPLLPWAWVAILICVILFVLWLVVMIAISRLNKPHKKDQM